MAPHLAPTVPSYVFEPLCLWLSVLIVKDVCLRILSTLLLIKGKSVLHLYDLGLNDRVLHRFPQTLKALSGINGIRSLL